MGKHLVPSWHNFQVGFLFRPHHTFFMVTPRSVGPIVHIVRLSVVSYLSDIIFQGQVPLFERSLSSKGAVPYHYTQCPCWFFILERYKLLDIILWSQTVGQSRPNNRNYSRYKGSETLAAYRVRKHNKTGQTIKQTENKHERSRFQKSQYEKQCYVSFFHRRSKESFRVNILVQDPPSIFQDRIINIPTNETWMHFQRQVWLSR